MNFLSIFFIVISFAFAAQPPYRKAEEGIHEYRLKNFARRNIERENFIEQKVDEERPAQAYLSKVEAARRSSSVSNVSYDLKIDLSRSLKKNRFHGKVKIKFDFNKEEGLSHPLTIDFTKGHIKSVTINGWPIAVKSKREKGVFYNGYFLSIPLKKLRQGTNKIKIRFSHEYDLDDPSKTEEEQEPQEGLHRIIEEYEGEVNNYLYTQFEVYAANKMFPCFDQPDLKAKYSLQVKAPKHWEVISSTNVAEVSKGGKNKIWKFGQTPTSFSPYLFSLHAGEYKKWEGKSYKNRIPMSLYTRQSRAKEFEAQVEEWFQATHEGFEFFEKYFGINYPFEKYDQIIVPEFWAGAMENVGAVTFNEGRFVIDDELRADEKKLADRKRYIIKVILHEMTHMWFGNLVTMKWWGDLWLNESFATYFPSLAIKESTLITQGHESDFHINEKLKAYRDDNSEATPVVSSASDTLEAELLFDRMRYQKGASLLKQLSFHIGKEIFQLGIQKYLSKFRYSQVESQDFFTMMDNNSVINLEQWFKDWFTRSGHNIISADYKCNNGLVTDFAVVQEEGSSEVLREHKMNFAFFNLEGSNWNRTFLRTDAYYSGKRTDFPRVLGKKCPDFVFLNYDDFDYVKVRLNEKSNRNFNNFINSNSESLLNQSLLQGDSFIKP